MPEIIPIKKTEEGIKETCPVCGGKNYETCENCGGTGEVVVGKSEEDNNEEDEIEGNGDEDQDLNERMAEYGVGS